MSSFVRVPPDSTGKKIRSTQTVDFEFDNQTGTISIGDTITGVTSGVTGEVTAIISKGYAANTGKLYVKNATGDYVDNENLQISAVTVATANITANIPLTDQEIQNNIIVDKNNPENSQKIDDFGASVVTFTDGAPTFTPFGSMNVAQGQTIKDYRFSYEGLDDLFYDDISGGASVTWDPDRTVVAFQNPTTSGAKITRTSHYYHPYSPGIGTTIQMTVQVGDTGTTNSVRRWGYYDDNNGIFFELNGTTLYSVVRSSTTGSVVDTKIAQADWDTDKLDGTNADGFDLDVSKGNIYWIDFQWLGAGRVEFGVHDDVGKKVTANVHEHANSVNLPYMRTGTLPVRCEQLNQDSGGVDASPAGTTEFRLNCVAIRHSQATVINRSARSEVGKTKIIAKGDGEIALMGLRPKLTFNGQQNTGIMTFRNATVAALDGGSATAIIRMRTAVPSDVVNQTWRSVGTNSIAEFDIDGSLHTTSAGTSNFFSKLIQPGSTLEINTAALPGEHVGEINVENNGTAQRDFIITCEVVSGTMELIASMNWDEITL